VDEEYSKKEGIDFRKIKQHLEEAIPIRPRMQPAEAPVSVKFKDFDKAPVLSEKIEENPSLNFGTRLVDFLDRMAFEKTAAVGKHKLYSKLSKAMDEFGLRDVHLQEGARSKQKSVEQDLNISAFHSTDLNKQTDLARKVFCDFLRQVDPLIVATDDQIITKDRLKSALKTVAEKNTGESKELFIINRDHETLESKPLASARIEDAAAYALKGETNIDLKLSDLVRHEDFIASLAIPTVSSKNIAAIWETNLRPLTEELTTPANQNSKPGSAAPAKDDALDMAENRSLQGLATTTLRVLDDKGEQDISVHIVFNSARNKALVVSEKVPSKLLAAFREAGITHVDRNDPTAKAKIETALSDLTRNMPEATKTRLTDAFKYRNDVESDTAKLSDLLADGKIDVMYGKYVVKNQKKAL
jgi:hypothetical protein